MSRHDPSIKIPENGKLNLLLYAMIKKYISIQSFAASTRVPLLNDFCETNPRLKVPKKARKALYEF